MAGKESRWPYSPSLAVGAIMTGIFAILTILHTIRLFKTRTWFCIPFIVGGIFEAIGYGARAASNSNSNRESLPLYIMQALLILLAPILFAASVYMILGRLIRATGAESYAIIRVTRITKIFVGGDILCFLVQAMGAGMLSGADSKEGKDRGQNVILGGLILQIIIFLLFLLVAMIFHRRLRNRPTGKTLDTSITWERMLSQLYIVSVLITIRNLFRVIEYGAGEDGYLLQNEWPIYVFDALLMAIVLAVCSFWYVGKMRSRQDDIDLSSAESGVRVSRRK
ncbi:related to Rtm1p [Phialocephala subalpina]|uniref:Related to Rtm1p n=1 Tax=Phialocephala subalpina TaxID=576137 RepID=A0A1L7WF32_9HELO|nr:related to Rtm1p [Phialocephala subalpina]